MRFAVVAGIALILSASSAVAEDVWVQVRESKVRSKPLFYAPGISSVQYGDKLSKSGDDNGWASVRAGGAQGYIPVSAISRQQIVLTAKALTKLDADASDVVLAGKGFSKEVEQSFKTSDSSARFDRVDQVERAARVSTGDVQQFVKSGGLNQ